MEEKNHTKAKRFMALFVVILIAVAIVATLVLSFFTGFKAIAQIYWGFFALIILLPVVIYLIFWLANVFKK
ncbi:MAG: hypothetical protein K6G65_07105 [Lachnospiraceae bacterium]|nr:hypothetical protein [Lachnospiraceae bacterium]